MIVGLTGGIASGKSSISNQLARMEFLIIDADVLAREVVQPGTDGLREILAAFGEQYAGADGTLDRERLGALIFSDPEARARLNGIVHPRVREAMREKAEEYTMTDARRVAVLDVPLLFEVGTHTLMDVTVLVYAPVPLQLTRLMKRNGLDERAARQRIGAQMDIEEKRRMADVIVENVGKEENVPRLATALGKVLRTMAAEGARADGSFDRAHVGKVTIR
ncbi:MAG: dephospho-CoA kinase [Bacilli bacterium]